jgi:hypothetical protein
MLLEVLNVRVVGDYVLRLEFTDGVVRDVDLGGELHGEVFVPLKDPGFFSQVAVNPETGTIEWPNGAAFAPEFLARIGREVKRVA